MRAAIFESKLQSYATTGYEAWAFHVEKRLRESLATVDGMGLGAEKKELAKTITWLYFLGYYENPDYPEKGSVSVAKQLGQESFDIDTLLLMHLFAKKHSPAQAAEMVLRSPIEPHAPDITAPTEQGVETWFRTASGNLYTRRRIVDAKSHIMITINSIILSVVLGNLHSELVKSPHLLWAIVPLVLTNVLSIAFAILATRPVLADGLFTKEEVLEKKARLTTFDDFYKMPLEQYEWAVGEMLKDRRFVHNSLVRDMHRLGVDLAMRYKNILRSHQIFLGGLVLSLLSFGFCYAIL
ncbi:MAG: hypothetical protein GC192_22945 [Bacteroidetes bacterium]|nr:hypothetical protein [Bacteroidota bacterium]